MKKIDFKNKNNILAILLACCAACQFLIIQYFNFFEAKIHMGVDVSWEYLKTIVIGKNGGFFPVDLLNSDTEPLNDKIFLLAAPFYRLTKNVFVAFGITNLIMLAATIIVLYIVLDKAKLGIVQKLIIINLLICPYLMNGYILQNDLSYFSCTFGGGAYYSTMILGFMMILRVLISKETFRNKKNLAWMIISFVLLAFIGVSSGPMMIVMVLVPAIGFMVVYMFLENNFKVLISWKAIYLYISFAIVAAGRMIAGMCGIPYHDDSRFLTTAEQFWENLHNIFLGYMLLLGAIPKPGSETTPASLMGVGKLCGLVIFLVMLIAVIYYLIKVIRAIVLKENYDKKILFLETIILITILEFSIVFVSYGEQIFECRYLIISTICGFILVGYFIQDLAEELLFKKVGVVVLFVAIIGADLISDYLYKIDDNLCWKVDEMLEAVEATDAGLVVTWGKELTPMERVMRVVDESRVYKAMTKDNVLEVSGDYSIYDDTTEYAGPTILIVSTDDPAAPQEVLDKFEVLDKQDYVTVYYSKTNPIDLNYWRQFGPQKGSY